MIIVGGFKDGRWCVVIMRDFYGNVVDFIFDYGEVDIWMLFYVMYVVSLEIRIIIYLFDIDVFVLSVVYFVCIIVKRIVVLYWIKRLNVFCISLWCLLEVWR